MEGKKISFGFMKTKKAEKPQEAENKEYIACVEEKSIKVIGGEKVEENLPIVIPLKPNTLVTAEKLKEIAEKVEKGIEEAIEEKVNVKEEIIPENETLDQMAVRELMTEAKNEIKLESKELTLPVPDKLIADGAKESTLEDYDSIPVQDFGMAMLRGMGWDASQEKSKFKQPELRPKGLGLGADKVVKAMQNKKTKEEEDLSITKNSFVKVTAGKYCGFYGKVVSLDEDNGRVMVDITMKKETVSLSEFMMQAVTKSEYDREAKVLNKEAFDSYKQKDSSVPKEGNKDIRPSRDSPKDKDSFKPDSNKDKRDRLTEDKYDKECKKESRERRRFDDKIEEKHRRRHRSYSSSSSSSAERSRHRSKHKSKSNKPRKDTTDSSDSEKKNRSKSPSRKRDIDKKRKGKKKKRDRDRSPSYRKYRK